MSYCVNPSCPQPKNPKNAQVCQACGSSLRLHNRYQILGILGKGGFGATFAAADLSLPGTPVCVVKQLRPATDDENVYRMAKQLFEREAETLGQVGNHPQVPRLLDYFEEGQQFYLLQEYVKGQNLHQEVKKKGPFPEAGVKQFLSEILPIMDYIHAQKVIHRDIKPANLIRRQTDRKLVVIDFGAVKTQVNTVLAASSSQTALTAFAVGTAGFAPPEQMAMRPVYASDIYAIGVTCVYLLTAKSPKEIGCDPSTGEIAWEPYVTLNEKFADVLKKMLEVSVKHRFKTAQEVLDAMDVLPYEEGMLQSMITMPVSKSDDDNPPSSVTGLSRANRSPRTSISRVRGGNSPSTEISSRTRGNYGSDTQLGGNSPATGMSTNVRSSRMNTSMRSPSNSSIAGPAGNMNFQVAGGAATPKKKAREVTGIKKPKKLTAKAILEAYQKGRKDFTQQDLPEINLARANLQGINFYESKMEQSNFQGCNLSRADFGRTNLHKARLKNANLTDAYLGYADLGGADLSKANLAGANLKYANLRGTNLCGANLQDAHVTADQLAIAKTNWSTVMPSGKWGIW